MASTNYSSHLVNVNATSLNVKNGGLETVCKMVYSPLRRGRVLKQCKYFKNLETRR